MCMGKIENSVVFCSVFTLAFVTVMFLYIFLIMPQRDQIAIAIINCMGNDHSRESYEICVSELKP